MQAIASRFAIDASGRNPLPCGTVKQGHKESVYIRVDPELKRRWEAMLSARKIGQNEAGSSFVRWLVDQEPEVQLMVIGSIPARADLVEMILKRLQKTSKPRTTVAQTS